MSSTTATARPVALLSTAASAVVVGGIFGGATNAVSAALSPEYFHAILIWGDFENIWRAAVAQGILVGLGWGVFFSFVFTLVVGVASRAQCPFPFALRHLIAIVVGVLVCWVVGGLIGLGIAALSPEFFQQTFLSVPEDHGRMLRYAWAGGSSTGAMAGALLGLVIGCILFAVRWRRAHPR